MASRLVDRFRSPFRPHPLAVFGGEFQPVSGDPLVSHCLWPSNHLSACVSFAGREDTSSVHSLVGGESSNSRHDYEAGGFTSPYKSRFIVTSKHIQFPAIGTLPNQQAPTIQVDGRPS